MDKIEELKKLLWVLDSKHSVSIPQTKENIDHTAQEIVKLFAIPCVIKSVCDHNYIETIDEDWCVIQKCSKCGDIY